MSVLHKNKVVKLENATHIVAKSSEFKIENGFDNYYPNQLENESEIHYKLFINFLEERNFNKLSEMVKINFNKSVSRRQLFNIANKNNWRERAMKFDKEINFSLMQGAANRVKKMKMEQMELLICVMEKVNNSMRTFNNQILTDLDVFHQVIDFEDDAKLKRMQSTMKIFKDYVYVSSKLQNMIKESGMEDFDILDYLKEFEEEDNGEEEVGDLDLDLFEDEGFEDEGFEEEIDGEEVEEEINGEEVEEEENPPRENEFSRTRPKAGF